jgi:hypothetical protein
LVFHEALIAFSMERNLFMGLDAAWFFKEAQPEPQRGIKVMTFIRTAQTKKKFLITIIALSLILTAPAGSVFAHGGEDHGDQKAPVVSKGTNMIVRVARAGDLEVVIKDPPIEPDKETLARVFITHFATNEPISGAKVVVVLQGSMPIEVGAVASTTPGMYEVKLPPLPQGLYKLIARIEHDGENKTAEYGSLAVAPLPVSSSSALATWARTALLILGGLTVVGVLGAFIYRLLLAARRSRIRGEAATA